MASGRSLCVSLIVVFVLQCSGAFALIACMSQVRRNLSNIACQDFGRVILTDISSRTVARCEMKVGASLIASARLFYTQMIEALRLPSCEGAWSLCVHAYRQDASNGHKKICAMELETLYTENVHPEAVTLQWSDFKRLKRLADLIVIEDETGPGSVDVTLRGLKSLGCPSWREEVSDT